MNLFKEMEHLSTQIGQLQIALDMMQDLKEEYQNAEDQDDKDEVVSELFRMVEECKERVAYIMD